MRLFKFRSLSHLEFVLDIIYNQRLYCATYDKLNDPFEGLFLSNLFDLSKRPPGSRLLSNHAGAFQVVGSAKQIRRDIIENARICSLSHTISDVRLWSYYGDGHTGIAIEMEVDENETHIHQVEYREELPTFNVEKDSTDRDPEDKLTRLLTRKTHHWSHEQEYRIITSEKYYDIQHKVRAIYLGSRVSPFHADILKKAVSSDIAIFHTKINPQTVQVEKHCDRFFEQQLNQYAEI